MLKTIFAVVLAGTLLIAGGTAAYNTFQAAQAVTSAEAATSQDNPYAQNRFAPGQPEWSGGNQANTGTSGAMSQHTPQAVAGQGNQNYGQQINGGQQTNANRAQGYGAQGQGGSGNGYQGGRNPNFQGGGNHNQSRNAGATGNGTPQATPPEWITLHGTVSDVTPMDFLLTLDDGSTLRVDSGNQYFLKTLGLTLKGGESVTIVGYWMQADFFVAAQITLDGGTTYVLRDEFGRPLWSGGSH